MWNVQCIIFLKNGKERFFYKLTTLAIILKVFWLRG